MNHSSRAFALMVFVIWSTGAAWAQSPLPSSGQVYPLKPIKIVIPFPPGNTTDIMTRLIGPRMTERIGQQIIVENRPGASGMIGMDLVAKAPADGYTLAAAQGGNMVVLPHTSRNIPYDPLKDFTPIAVSTTNYLGIVAGPSAPFQSVPEMIAYAKANPGKLTVATNGEGGFPHLAFEQLRLMGEFSFTHVPYKGSSGSTTDVMGGQVQTSIDGITPLTPLVKSGRLRLLAITNRARVSLWPDTPTVAEAVPGYESGGWFGYVAPAGTSREVVRRLNEEINRAMKQPEVSEKLTGAGLIIVSESPEYFAELLKSDYAKYGKLTRDIGFQPQ